MSKWSVGIDIGGTFTDLVALQHATGTQRSFKVLTTHGDPSMGVIEGIQQLMRNHGIPADSVELVVHATTLFTNALIERRGACTGLLTTQGFADIAEMGNERKYNLYDLQMERAQPLAPRHLGAEVAGRLNAQGQEIEPLDIPQALAVVDTLVHAGVESLAICLLHAYASPQHELALQAAIQARHPQLTLTLSSQTAPVIREYERTTTTLANAYIKPMARAYLDKLADELAAIGLPRGVLMMLS